MVDNAERKGPEGRAEVHKGSSFAVGRGTEGWYIAECKPTRERTVRAALERVGYEVFVASFAEERVYGSRNRYRRERVVIPGKVFVRAREEELMPILLNHASIYRFMLNRASRVRSYAMVEEGEMRQLQYVLGHAENPVVMAGEGLRVGERVRVMRGALAGLEGWYYGEGHSSYVVIRVTMGTSHYVYTEIGREDIQRCE